MSQVFVRSDNLKDKVFDVKLRIPEWKVLFAVDGEMDTDKIAGFLDMPAPDVSETLQKLQGMQLVAGANGAPPQAAAPEPEPMDFPEVIDEPESEPETVADIPEPGEPQTSAEVEDATIDLTLPDTDMPQSSIQPADDAADGDDEDLDRLIGNLLDDESLDISQPEIDTEALEEAASAEAPAVDADEDFDLGSIFEEDIAEADTALEDMLGTPETDVAEPQAPAEPEAPPTPAEPEAPADVVADSTILVVDDSVVIRKMVEIALENESYNIVSVATGKEALTYLDENNPDLIILDIMLSDVNGLDVLKAIKASKQIPVVMLSAKDTPRETTKAKQLGADDFIPKPFKDEELVNKIKELIKK